VVLQPTDKAGVIGIESQRKMQPKQALPGVKLAACGITKRQTKCFG